MSNIGRVAIKFGADSGEFQSKMGQIRNQLRQSEKSFKMTTATVMRLGFAISGIVTSGVIARLTKQGLANVDAMAKQADMLDMTTEGFRGFQRQAERAGVGVETFNRSMERLAVVVAQARDGASASGRAFQRLGLDIDKVAKMRGEERLFAIAGALEKVQDRTTKVQIAYELFGRQGIKMLKIMEEGEEAMRKANERARALGVTVSRFDATKVEQANDAWLDMGGIVEGLQNQLAVKMAPILTKVAELITDATIEFGGMGKVAERVVEYMVTGFAVAADAVNGLKVAFKAGEVAMIGLGSLIATGAQDIQTVWQTVAYGVRKAFMAIQVSILSILNKINEGFRDMVGGSIGQLNRLIEASNKINPFGNIATIQWQKDAVTATSLAVDSAIAEMDRLDAEFNKPAKATVIDNIADGARNAFAGAKQELYDLMDNPPPSTKIIAKFGEINAAAGNTSAMFQKVAEDAEEMGTKTATFAEMAAARIGQFGNALETALMNASANGKLAMSDLRNFVLAEIQRMIIRMAVLRPLFAGLGGLFGGAGTTIGSAFMQTAAGFGGARAKGGDVSNSKSYLVGEKGPELFTPNQSGYVTPNHKMHSGGGGGVNIVINADNADAGRLMAIERTIMALSSTIEQRALQAVSRQRQRYPLAMA